MMVKGRIGKERDLRILAWEYVTAGGWRECGASESLIAEGRMMVETLARDLTDAGAEVLLPRDDAADPWAGLEDLTAQADAVWPVAPETGGILEKAVSIVAGLGRPVLASRPDALAAARSKWTTSRRLAEAGIRAVPTFRLSDPLPESAHGWVVKPDDGAGADETRFLAVPPISRSGGREGAKPEPVIQPFLPGTPASFSMLACDGKAWLLSCNLQKVACADGAFSYRGGIVGGAEDRRGAWTPLAEAVAGAFPGLWGYVGVDLIDGETGPVVLEINPRLTTSYAGLRDSIGINPAGLVLDLLRKPLSGLVRPLAPCPVGVEVPE